MLISQSLGIGIVELIYILAAIATILVAIRAVKSWLKSEEIYIVLCSPDGSPRTDVYVEGGNFGMKNPDIRGRVRLSSGDLDTFITVYDSCTHRSLVRQKLRRTGDDCMIPIIVPTDFKKSDFDLGSD